METLNIYLAAKELGHSEPISVEPDGTVWTGADNERNYLTDKEQKAVIAKATKMQNDKAAAKESVLTKLGLTADEVAALLS